MGKQAILPETARVEEGREIGMIGEADLDLLEETGEEIGLQDEDTMIRDLTLEAEGKVEETTGMMIDEIGEALTGLETTIEETILEIDTKDEIGLIPEVKTTRETGLTLTKVETIRRIETDPTLTKVEAKRTTNPRKDSMMLLKALIKEEEMIAKMILEVARKEGLMRPIKLLTRSQI